MRKKAITGFGILLLVVLAVAVVFFFSFKTVIVRGPSMEPTFKDGRRLLASRAYWMVGSVAKKDIVVVKDEESGGYMIKRVAYVGGETVDYQNIPDDWSLTAGPYVVPEGSVYVLGDNWSNSEDSRKYGPVKNGQILGKIIVLPKAWEASAKVVMIGVAALFVLLYVFEKLRKAPGRLAKEGE